MKRQVLTGFVCLAFAIQINAQYDVSGRIYTDDNEPLQGASILISELNMGTISNSDGIFSLTGIPSGKVNILFSFVGYNSVDRELDIDSNMDLGQIILKQKTYSGEEVTISALRVGTKTPMAFTDISKQEIVEKNCGQDIPYIVGLTPSVITSSDAGLGIGYTSMRIRGTDASRINVTINGIPLNDAESHSVFWVDLPELASSTEQIQIQRGVGTSTNGAAAFGATVNMQTNLLKKEAYAGYDMTAGSFNTFRNTISAGTGIIKEKYAFDMRVSDLHSDGYIDRSWTDLQSYYFAAGRYGEKSTLKFITFGGFEELYQSWGGVPSYLLVTDRRYNEMGAYIDSAGRQAYYDNQVDHYKQIHYQLHYAKEITKSLKMNAALHYTLGNGYYEQYETDQDHAFYGMEYPICGNDTIRKTDLIRRKWLDNDFYGAIASINYDTEKSTLILGGGWNHYFGRHFGKVIWAQYIGNNSPGHQWYEGSGDKTDWNVYGKMYYYLNKKITTYLDLQLRNVNHDIDGKDANNRNVTQEHSFLFFNPKAGVHLEPYPGHRAFLSYARANREPNRNNYTDAPLNRTPVQETLNDFEAGYSVTGDSYKAGVTLYYMDYNDQLVLTGEINEVGYPLMTNVPDSYRAGAEFEISLNYFEKIMWQGNITVSKNEIRNFVNYTDNWDYWSDPDNEPYQIEEHIGNSTLAFSPAVIASGLLEYQAVEHVKFSLTSKYVGKQFIDNTSNSLYTLSPYFVNDLKISYKIKPDWADQFIISMMVNNILNVSYETNAWLYRYFSEGSESFMDGYFPQAGRYIIVGLTISL